MDLSAEFWGRVGLGDVMLDELNYNDAAKMYHEGLHYLGTSADSRLFLGLGRSFLALRKLDDAALYLNRCAVACVRHSYVHRLRECQESYGQLQMLKTLVQTN